MFKFIHVLSLSVAVSAWSRAGVAQDVRASAASPSSAADADDLEVPATSAAAAEATPGAAPPRAGASSPGTAPSPAVSAAMPALSAATPTVNAGPAASKSASEHSENAALRREVDQLRVRLELVERAQEARPRAPQVTPNASPSGYSNLEKNATSRPVPTGLRIGGYLQTQYESNQLSVDQLQVGGAPLNQDRFTLRRGRIRLDRGWQYANGTLELDANTLRGVSVGIRRAEGSLLYRGNNPDDFPPLVMVSLGVTDLPFGFELLESSRVRPFMERSLGSSALFPTEMDLGLKLSGAISFLRYAFAITNGEPLDPLNRYPRDPNAAKDISGRMGVETEPLPELSIAFGTSFYRGKGFHAGTDASKPSFSWLDVNENRTIDPGELQASPGTAATPSLNFKRWAYALDVELNWRTRFGTTRLAAEGFVASNMDRGYLIADPGLGGNDVREAGGYVALVQDVTRFAQVGLRAAYYDPNSDFFNELRGRQVPTSLSVTTLSPMVALRLQEQARLSFEYDFVRDHLAKDARGVPTDAKNNQLTLRLQVEL